MNIEAVALGIALFVALYAIIYSSYDLIKE